MCLWQHCVVTKVAICTPIRKSLDLPLRYHMDLILSHILVLGFTFHNIADWRYKILCSNLIVLESKKHTDGRRIKTNYNLCHNNTPTYLRTKAGSSK